MNLLDRLTDDHKEALALIGSLEGSVLHEPPRSKSEIFSELKQKLEHHTKIEEQFFYPVLERFEETRDVLSEAYKDHQRVDELLSQLSDYKKNSQGQSWEAALNDLKSSVSRHIEKEETELFPKARNLIGLAQLEEAYYEIERLESGQSKRDSLIFPASRLG